MANLKLILLLKTTLEENIILLLLNNFNQRKNTFQHINNILKVEDIQDFPPSYPREDPG
jgi:hypothetical protein